MPASVETIKIALQAYGDRYSEVALALADPEILWDERGSRAGAEPVAKRDAVEKAMRAYLQGWKSYSFELEEVAEVTPGEVVVGICREQGVDGNSQPVDRRFGGLWTIKDGKIASWTTYATPREAVKAARGLRGGGDPRPAEPAPAAPKPEPAQRPMEAVPTPPGHEAPPSAAEQKRMRAKARAKLQAQRRAAG